MSTSPKDVLPPLLFEQSRPGRIGTDLPAEDVPAASGDEALFRDELPFPELSQLEVMRHFTRLSQLNYGIDTTFFPLGSCTMKYNPRVNERLAYLPGFAALHPLQEESGAPRRRLTASPTCSPR